MSAQQKQPQVSRLVRKSKFILISLVSLYYNTSMDYSRFQTVYANVPEKLRNEIVAIVDEKPYSWNAANSDIQSDDDKCVGYLWWDLVHLKSI